MTEPTTKPQLSARIFSRGEFEELLLRFETEFERVEPGLKMIADDVESEFKDFFLHLPAEVDPFAYGLTQVSARCKSIHSMKRNFHRLLMEDSDGMVTFRKDECYTLENLLSFADEDPDRPISAWCKAFKDVIGVRLIARSQRGKYQIFRAIEYLCDIHASDRRGLPGLLVPSIAATLDSHWKYYNPPSVRAYYSPYIVNRYHKAVSSFARLDFRSYAPLFDKLDQSLNQDLDGIEPEELTKLLTFASTIFKERETIGDTGVQFLMKDSGYATLQRNVEFFSGSQGIQLEVQIRTALEHCWAEPEHAMSYKGDNDPVTEEVKAIFRSYGLSLVAADDSLQMALDKHRIQNDHVADYGDRSLKPFRILASQAQANRTFEQDLNQIYDYVRLGFIGDAIVLVEQTRAKFVADRKKVAVLKIEEAICHLHNLTLLGDKDLVVGLVDDVIRESERHLASSETTEEDRLFWLARQFWATFRKGHCHLLTAEYLYVQFKREAGYRTNLTPEAFEKVRNEVFEGYYTLKVAGKWLTEGDTYRSITTDVEGSKTVPAELELLLGRCWGWMADLSASMTPEMLAPWLSDLSSLEEGSEEHALITSWIPQNRFRDWQKSVTRANRVTPEKQFHFACLCMAADHAHSALASVLRLRKSREKIDFQENNDIDLAAVNATLWFHRRMHKLLPEPTIRSESNKLFELLKAFSNVSSDQRRVPLLECIEHISTEHALNETLEQKLAYLRISELKILDTVIGFRAMSTKSVAEKHFLSECNAMITRALIRVAARGDFAFDSLFAMELLARPRR